MFKKIFTMLLILVMVLSFSSCTSEVSAQQIVNDVIKSPDKIKTFQYDMSMNMDKVVPLVDGTSEEFVTMDVIGVVDVENKQLKMVLNTHVLSNNENVLEAAMEYYLIDSIMYIGIDVPDIEFIWVKAEMPMEYWALYNQVEPQIVLLEEATDVTLIGSEEVGGIDCYVLEIIPDMEKLWEASKQQSDLVIEGTLIETHQVYFQEVFKSFSMKQWIAKDTHFMTKAKIDMVVELYPEESDLKEEELAMTLDYEIELTAYHYNQPVSIILPTAAEDAIEMPIFS